MKVLLCGQKWFGAQVYEALRTAPGIDIIGVFAPKDDRLGRAAHTWGTPLYTAGTLNAETIPEGVDLIIAAHSHDFIGQKTLLRSRFGGIGYHPSLLPVHRGRDAVRWAIRMGDRVTGGSVYRLSNKVDGGNIIAQEYLFIRPDDTAEELWRRDLAPMGVRMLREAVERFATEGLIPGDPQDEALATWEPALDAPPIGRPDLDLIPYLG